MDKERRKMKFLKLNSFYVHWVLFEGWEDVYWILAAFSQERLPGDWHKGMHGKTGRFWVSAELLEWRMEPWPVKVKKRPLWLDCRLDCRVRWTSDLELSHEATILLCVRDRNITCHKSQKILKQWVEFRSLGGKSCDNNSEKERDQSERWRKIIFICPEKKESNWD